jgi:hypothetical protein
MIPSYSQKAISGWSNDPCKVTSHKIDEKKMGYRGSKSEFPWDFVKEQRVDGSWCNKFKPLHLRCTLMGFERNYPINNPSKQLNKLFFSTINNHPPRAVTKLNPWFITGFADAEGCFSILIKPDAKLKMKWRVSPVFNIKLHIKDFAILEEIKHTLPLCGRKNKTKRKRLGPIYSRII